ncbi:hypothetical protein N7462_007004, partial [Penicillium macrosclerotiorum]|uniref:uncharacterized protein n=1 Tax=Penicillium macrosclerotiorum TaxID=303699 RepID=UPI00254931B0
DILYCTIGRVSKLIVTVMESPRMTFYFDIGSPFSYIAFHVLQVSLISWKVLESMITALTALQNSPVFAGCAIDYVPVLLRDLFQKCQNSPPISVKNKFQWVNKERLYWSSRFGVPMSEPIPKGFPASTEDAQVALSFIAQSSSNELVKIAGKLFHMFWANGNTHIANPDNFTAVIEEELGRELAKMVTNATASSESKIHLNENTEKAFDSGAFGLPWFDCTNSDGEDEGFWGIDHLGRVADFLRLDTTLDPAFKVLL